MIELVKKDNNINLNKPGHKHDNKELLDSVKKVSGKYYIDKKAIRMLQDGATVRHIEFTTNDDEIDVMRLILNWDDSSGMFVYNYIDIPIYSYYDTYADINPDEDVEEYVYGAVLDFGTNVYTPMEQVDNCRTNSNGFATIYPNMVYNFGKLEKLHIILASGADYMANAYYFSFIAEDLTIFTLPEDVVWGNDNEIVIEGGKRYEVSIFNNVALWNAATI